MEESEMLSGDVNEPEFNEGFVIIDCRVLDAGLIVIKAMLGAHGRIIQPR